MSDRPRSGSADACAASEHDPEAEDGRVPPLIAQEEPAHGETEEPRHIQDARGCEAPRARRAVLQASLTEPPGTQRPGSPPTRPAGPRRGLGELEGRPQAAGVAQAPDRAGQAGIAQAVRQGELTRCGPPRTIPVAEIATRRPPLDLGARRPTVDGLRAR